MTLPIRQITIAILSSSNHHGFLDDQLHRRQMICFQPRAASGAEAVDIILDAYDNAPVYEWDAIQEGIDLPNLQRTFAGIFGYIVSLLLDPETGDQLLTPFLDLLGVEQEDKDFFNQ